MLQTFFEKSVVRIGVAIAAVVMTAVPALAASDGVWVPPRKREIPPVETLKKTEVTGKKPAEILNDHKLGTMRNPFTDDAKAIEEGKKIYFEYSCNGCHGGGGGGGMCPSLKNDVWIWGADDDTLYRLIVQGTDAFQKEHELGSRVGSENVVGPMPPFADIIESDEKVWKIIAYVRSLYKGNRRKW